jgi:hypothetical protein
MCFGYATRPPGQLSFFGLLHYSYVMYRMRARSFLLYNGRVCLNRVYHAGYPELVHLYPIVVRFFVFCEYLFMWATRERVRAFQPRVR